MNQNIKRMLYNFMSKYYKNRNFNLKVRQFLPMYFEGELVTKLPPNKRPTNLQRAFAEIQLGFDYACDDTSPMAQDFRAIYNAMCSQLSTACTYHHVAGNNKRFENGTPANIMIYAVDEAYSYFMD